MGRARPDEGGVAAGVCHPPGRAVADLVTGVRRPVIIGTACIAMYLAVALLTPEVTGRHVRPLFDSFGNTQPYHWVNPPKEFASTNVKPPDKESVDLAMLADGTENRAPGTADGQALLSLIEGA